jgi:hypothetical protein
VFKNGLGEQVAPFRHELPMHESIRIEHCGPLYLSVHKQVYKLG